MNKRVARLKIVGITLVLVLVIFIPSVNSQFSAVFSESLVQKEHIKNGSREFVNNLDRKPVHDSKSITGESKNDLPLETENWWNDSWLYRKNITIDHTMVDDDFINFPVLISLPFDDDLASHVQNNGSDIVFIDYSGNKLNHEIELFNGSTGELVAWVNVTSLSSTMNTTLYMYYGNQNCANQENVSGVWDSNYKMVQHLNETSGTHYDSTSYDNDGTPYFGVVQDAVGKVDGADEFDGSGDYVEVLDDDSLHQSNAISVEVWGKADAFGVWRSIAAKDRSGTSEWWFGYNSNNKIDFKFNGQNGVNINASTVVTDSDWHHLVGVYNGSYIYVFVDGALDSTPLSYSDINTNTGTVNIAITKYWGDNCFSGILDEFRISNIARNGSWINTSYNTMNSPSTFYSVGGEEKLDAIPPEIKDNVVTPDPQEVGGYVNITCNVTDNVGVNVVKVNITYPDNSQVNVSMLGGSYYYNTTYNQMGTYSYFIWANDTSGNVNTSTVYHFDIRKLYNISLNTSWNLISLPFNESVAKTTITVRNNSIDYNWTDAVSGGIIFNFFYRWDGTTYTHNDTLEPGYGYWMWAYYDCELLFSSSVSHDEYLTTLQQSWIIMGLPYNESLAKEDLIVHYNGGDYSWENATSNNNPTGGPIILGFIYGWDRTNQHYVLSDAFDPGYGYWMYAYYNCTLLRPET